MRILVLTPTERENRNMEAALERASSLKNDYTVVRCGIGKACAAASTARALCSSGRPFDMLAVIGYAASAEDAGRARSSCRAVRAITTASFPTASSPR